MDKKDIGCIRSRYGNKVVVLLTTFDNTIFQGVEINDIKKLHF